ncbi:probable DNA-directed RNA polymerase [Nicotiana tomentosiformis]|uniref:probable DNA-directed RNA polymerase n=1 Tax=Nicotiana tomentosiformis TaxID=4098 RepID=UPI00388CE15F
MKPRIILGWPGAFNSCRSYKRDTKYSEVLGKFYKVLLDDEFYVNEHPTSTNISKYQNAVLELLRKSKVDKYDSDHRLIQLQSKIEELAYPYDDIPSMFEATPIIINLLIKTNAPSAKEYLKGSNKLTSEELAVLNLFHQYILEGIIVYIFGYIFNSINESPVVRLSTLVDQLDSMSRIHVRLLFERKKASVGSDAAGVVVPDSANTKNIGCLLVEFLLDRNVITISNDLSFTAKRVDKKEKGKYYKQKPSHVICNFDISILSIQLNLPMVCRPKSWDVVPQLKERGEAPKSLSDITGGYLSEPVRDFYLYNRYNLLASRDKNNFNILLANNYQEMCETMNALQGEGFEINVGVLDFINNNYNGLVETGLLMAKHLASLNIAAASNKLRETYLSSLEGKFDVKYPGLLKAFLTDIQRARYESFILDITSAYAGYEFYLPAFVDFRGRIYRMGVLHFHERELARSLIVFSKRQRARLASAETIITYATNASDPFQFLSKAITLGEFDSRVSYSQLPITQDASANAYQIISYFLLNSETANIINLIPTKGNKEVEDLRINDVYEFFVLEIVEYLKKEINTLKGHDGIMDHVCTRLNRKLVKSLLMLLIYGKTAYSMAEDIYQHYDNVFRKKECLAMASHIEKFFKWRFSHIVNLMSLIRAIVQDYMKLEAVNKWIYDRPSKKRRQVTLRVPTNKRDRKKTTTAITANFVHQKDANIAFYMIRNVKSRGIPIYTVHDNFITTPDFAPLMAGFYIDIFEKGPHPMEYINAFIRKNLMGVKCYISDYATLYKKEAFLVDILHNELLSLEPPEL